MQDNSMQDASQIDIIYVFLLFWVNKTFILLFTSIFGILSIYYALSIDPTYESSMLLKSKDDQGPNVSSSLGAIGMLAPSSMLGMQDNRTDEAIATFASKDFFKTLFVDEQFLKDLLAYKKYNGSDLYDEEIYDSQKGKWAEEPIFTRSHRIFLSHLTVQKEKLTGHVKFAIQHESPFIAAAWTEKILDNLNAYLRNMDIKESEASINYLTKMINQAKNGELKKVFAGMTETYVQKLMLAEISDDYIFKVIDSGYASDMRSKPNRAFICIFITGIAGIFSLLLIFFIDLLGKKILFNRSLRFISFQSK
tara:strand:- start:20118 stop:21041 length:924 start_codon:yes stop_codon:yes gene_type:complete